MHNLNIRWENKKKFRRKQKGTFHNIDLGNDILDTTAATWAIKTKIRKIEMYQTKVLLHSNGNSQHSVKAIYRMEENICNHTSDKLLLYKIYKKLIQMYNRKMNNPMKPTTKSAK